MERIGVFLCSWQTYFALSIVWTVIFAMEVSFAMATPVRRPVAGIVLFDAVLFWGTTILLHRRQRTFP